jgi:hypothetical protein
METRAPFLPGTQIPSTATLALVGFGLVLTLSQAVGCGSAPTKTPSPSNHVAATPSPNLIDACIVGRWKSTVGTLPETLQGASVTATGGGGTVLTFNADGSYSGDFAKTLPYIATASGGHRISVLATGAVAGSFTTVGGVLSLADTQTTLTVTTRVDGMVTSSQAASSTSSAGYTCTAGSALVLSSGAYSTAYVPVA